MHDLEQRHAEGRYFSQTINQTELHSYFGKFLLSLMITTNKPTDKIMH